MARPIRSEAAINRALGDTARAPRLAPVDYATIERARAAIRRHRTWHWLRWLRGK